MFLIKWLFSPLAFALGFLTPLFHQVLAAMELGPGGIFNLLLSLGIALALGITAQIRGNWWWHRA